VVCLSKELCLRWFFCVGGFLSRGRAGGIGWQAAFPNPADYARETATHKAMEVRHSLKKQFGTLSLATASDDVGICPSFTDHSLSPVKPSSNDSQLSHRCMQVARREGLVADLVIGADTIVDLHGSILEKPDGPVGARSMLSRLSGSKHQVHTGVVLVLPRAVDPATGKSPLVRAWYRGRERVEYSDAKVANRNVRGFGWQIAHAAVS
jgi:predicted house-cleaning NTP pyrophosphatase (Maf/HAM1 superfamily)